MHSSFTSLKLLNLTNTNSFDALIIRFDAFSKVFANKRIMIAFPIQLLQYIDQIELLNINIVIEKNLKLHRTYAHITFS